MKSGMMKCLAVALLSTATGCNDYGTKLDYNGSDVYYTKNVTEAEAKAVGDYLDKQGAFKDQERSFRIDKDGDVYKFHIILEGDYKSLAGYPEFYKFMGARISHYALKDAPVAVVICDNKFKALETLEADDVGKLYHFEKNELNYGGGITTKQASAVGKQFVDIGWFKKESSLSVQLHKMGDVFRLRFVIKPSEIDKKSTHDTFNVIADEIGQSALKGRKIEIHLADSNLKTKHVLRKGGKKSAGKKSK